MEKRARNLCTLLEAVTIIMMVVYMFNDSKILLALTGGIGIAAFIMEIALNPIEEDDDYVE